MNNLPNVVTQKKAQIHDHQVTKLMPWSLDDRGTPHYIMQTLLSMLAAH